MDKPIIYSTNSCYFCVAVKDWLDEIGVTYEDRNIDNPVDKIKAEKSLGHPISAVPIIVIGKNEIVGFDRQKIIKTLKEHGSA